MFTLIYRFFPGPPIVRWLAMLLILALLVWALMFYIYPAIQSLVTPPPVTVEEALGLWRAS